jgi:hypothetical protein
MNEKERILKMLDDGLVSPQEAAKLLTALQEHNAAKAQAAAEIKSEPPADKQEKTKTQVQMKNADGSSYTIEVPPGLVPAIAKVTGEYIKQSVKTAANDAWDGFKVMVKNKTTEVKTNVSNKVRGTSKDSEDKTAPATAQNTTQQEARKRIIQMVQNGRIGADEAARLIQQLDALQEDGKVHQA